MTLPEQFLNRMEQLLGEEYEDFLESYNRSKAPSLRVNFLKGGEEELFQKAGFLTDRVPWTKGGYYYQEEARPGRHPYHEAGAYYIQEASAMAPAAYLRAQPGERILDLCAAPGGKSTQIGADMRGQGLLICNEIHPRRAKILSENIERMGIRNGLVLNCEPAVLARRFPGYFDKILVDAPCSGEGMFRRKEEAVEEWSEENIKLCAARQRDILAAAAEMLRPGGRMVYSTCTFAPEEDEEVIEGFLREHPAFTLEETEKYPGMMPGMAISGKKELEKTIRLWPHKLKGEGHFVACLKKESVAEGGTACLWGEEKGLPAGELKEWEDFYRQYVKVPLTGIYLRFGDQLYLAPEGTPSLKGLKALRPGLHLGTFKKGRFEPSHALALFLRPGEALYELPLSLEEAYAFLAGRTLPAKGEKGWYLLTVDGYSLGWGKLSGGIMKNHYPRGLRK